MGDEIIRHLGEAQVTSYLKKFGFGSLSIKRGTTSNEISHGLLKVSAKEQIDFLRKLWGGHLLPPKALDKIKEASEISISKNSRLYGKTGTGCIDKGCMHKAGKQLGWFIGIFENKSKRYAFATNYSDLKPTRGFAGPKTQKIIQLFFDKYYSN